MRAWICIVLMAMVAVPLVGCATASTPVVEDHSGHVGTLATVAQRRMVITMRDYRVNPAQVQSDYLGQRYVSKFCSEPPPDVVDDLFSQFGASLDATAKLPEAAATDISLKLGLLNSVVTNAKQLFMRSQSIQYLRDKPITSSARPTSTGRWTVRPTICRSWIWLRRPDCCWPGKFPI